jgi:potassium-dependent mechanosensitive channel
LSHYGSLYRLASVAITCECLAARHRACPLILALLSTLIAPLWGGAQVPTSVAIASSAVPLASQPIPLPLIADRAEQLDYLLREIAGELAPAQELLDAQNRAEAQAEQVRQRLLQSRDLLAGEPTPFELGDEQRYWHYRSQEYAAERKLFTARAAKLQEQVATLDAQQPEWQATLDQVHGVRALQRVAERVQQQLDAIEATRQKATQQLNVVLTLQNLISQQDQEISEILFRLNQFRDQERSRILQQDCHPLWEAREQGELNQRTRGFYGSLDRSFTNAGEFLSAHRLSILALVCTYVLSLFGVLRLRNYVAHATRREVVPETLPVLKAPFSVALLVTLIGTGQYIASAPIGVALVFYLLFLFPVLRFLAPTVDEKLRAFLYALAVLYALEGIYLLAQLPLLFRRELYAVLVLAGFVTFGWLARPSRRRPLLTQNLHLRILVIGIYADLSLLAASLAANIFGFFSLAQLLGITALVGPFGAAALYCGVKVLTLILAAALHTRWGRSVLEQRAHAVEAWGRRLLAAAAFLLWSKVMLQLLTVYDSVTNWLSNLLQRPFGFENLHFTVGDILSITLILLGGYAFANAIIFLLRTIVLPKLRLNRGVPYAVLRVTYYVLLLLVFLIALSAAQVELNKFTVLTGAIGVGLGFGLQSIVNNFVSGLILLFERPIHIGDTVDVNGLVGTVRRIGARSSTVLTFQGAEVIVPNSNLLSNQLINWTLSSQLRRVDVPVRVAYGTDPERVIQLLEELARSHPGILLERPPEAFFMGFGENALNFELRFWCARQDAWFQLQSDVTVAVAKALRDADIEVPFPQRDLHVRSIGASPVESFASPSTRTTSSVSNREKECSHD